MHYIFYNGGSFRGAVMNIVTRLATVAFLWTTMVASVTANADEQINKNMALSFEPVGLLNGVIPITFRIGVGDRFSLGISAYDKIFNLTKDHVTGVGGGLSGKFHLSAPAFSNGWYVKVETLGGYWTVGEDAKKSIGFTVEPRLTAGYDWIWTSGFNITLGGGIKYTHYVGDQSKINDIAGFGFHGMFPNADLGVGWAF